MDEQAGALIGGMLGRRMFVCLSEPAGPAEAEESLLLEHLQYLISLEQRGALFVGGPFLEAGRPGQRSLYILRVDSESEARALMAEEPFHKAGTRTSTIHEFALNEGRVTVHLDFSTQRGGLDNQPAR